MELQSEKYGETDYAVIPGPKKQETKANDDMAESSTMPVHRQRRSSDVSLPAYYDSEPSSQPPNYAKSPSPTRSTRSSRPVEPQQAGAPASAIAAVLGVASLDEVYAMEKKKDPRSFSQRVKDHFFGKGYFPRGEQPRNSESSSEWNYWGARLDGRENKERALRRR
jgi:hypothetical protein